MRVKWRKEEEKGRQNGQPGRIMISEMEREKEREIKWEERKGRVKGRQRKKGYEMGGREKREGEMEKGGKRETKWGTGEEKDD